MPQHLLGPRLTQSGFFFITLSLVRLGLKSFPIKSSQLWTFNPMASFVLWDCLNSSKKIGPTNSYGQIQFKLTSLLERIYTLAKKRVYIYIYWGELTISHANESERKTEFNCLIIWSWKPIKIVTSPWNLSQVEWEIQQSLASPLSLFTILLHWSPGFFHMSFTFSWGKTDIRI